MNQLPRCFGKSWVKGDDECDECDLEFDCKDIVLAKGRNRLLGPAKEVSRRSIERNVEAMGVGGVKPAPRLPGEPIWLRVLKNFGYGMLSRAGVEASLLAEEERTRLPDQTYDDNDDD